MSFSKQREKMRTQDAIWKQQLRIIRKRRRHQAQQLVIDAQDNLGDDNSGLADARNESLEMDLSHGTIFVSVPSYRDPECPKTIADLFEKATYPGRIFVGVFQQNEPLDVDCMQSVTAQRFVSNIRVLRVDAGEAKGPVYARAMVEQHLFRDEQYYMNIDSHSLCVPGWDVEAIQQLLQCDSEKPVLTCYPLDYDIVTRQLPIDQPSTFLKFRDFHSRTGFPQQDPVRFRHSPTKPQPSLFWAAGFSFTLGTVVREVPFDPNLQYVFLGEEISMAARLFAAGYDTFAPMRNIIFHYTLRKTSTGAPRPTFWEQFYKRNGQCKVAEDVRAERKALERAGNARITALLKGLPIEAPYGASSVRTLDQFWEFVGLDFETRRHKRHAQLGLTLYATEQERYFKYGMETFV